MLCSYDINHLGKELENKANNKDQLMKESNDKIFELLNKVADFRLKSC